jgi:hypothetical protein
MSKSPWLSSQVEALRAVEREVPPLPPATRARAIARARAAVLAGGVRTHSRSVASSGLRSAVAVVLICFAGAAVGAVAYEVRVRLGAARELPPAPIAVPWVPPVSQTAAPAAIYVPPVASDVPPPRRPGRGGVVRAELALLQQAREAVAGSDYAAALPPLAEHLRRFKDGRFAEEREALRVTALAGLGRTDDAHRAAAAFRARFPRSVLLPVVR